MMAYIGEWVKHIVLLILVATFLDLLLPSSQMKRYIKLVVGFILILILLTPLLRLIQFDEEHLFRSLLQVIQEGNVPVQREVDRKQLELERQQEAAILQTVEAEWSEEIKRGLTDQLLLDVHHIRLTLESRQEELDVASLSLVLAERDVPQIKSHREQESIATVSIKQIEVVTIGSPSTTIKKELEKISEQQKKIEKEVLNYLSNEWNISVDKVSLQWVKG